MKTSLCVVLLACVLAPAAARAQTQVQQTGFRQNVVVDESLNRAGRIELGASLAGAMQFGSVTPEGGDSVSQTQVYIAPALVGGYMLLDWLELRLYVGVPVIFAKVGDTQLQNLFGVQGAIQALYQRDFVLGLGGYGGLGVGGFWGGRSEDTAMPGVEQTYTQVGGLVQLMGGLMAMPGPRLVLRGGIRIDMLFGSETADFDPAPPDSSFFNVQVVLELGIGFRFN